MLKPNRGVATFCTSIQLFKLFLFEARLHSVTYIFLEFGCFWAVLRLLILVLNVIIYNIIAFRIDTYGIIIRPYK